MGWFFGEELAPRLLEEEHQLIPLLNIQVQAGTTGIIREHPRPTEYFPFKRSWLKNKGYRDDAKILERLFLIKSRGESMEPTISDGEVLLVDVDDSMRVPEPSSTVRSILYAGAVPETNCQ